ncbi:MAG: NAD(P)/FAD-dependent oxidoreductase [Clostridia bacterium]|nr:NAD(P)/FAD-dependent oxidoreductase [Clostridia bacterium]
MKETFDVIVVGGGIVGTAVLDRLAKYDLKCLLVEKGDDVANFATRANSGIVHAGYDCTPGTLKAKFNVLGNPLVWRDAEELGVKHLKCGSIVVAKADGKEGIDLLAEKAKANGVEVEIWDRAKTVAFEPHVADDIELSLYAPSAGIVSPYQMAIGYADRAILNGASILLEAEVQAIEKQAEVFNIKTSKGEFEAKLVVNCAGPNGASVNDMAGAEHYETTYRRGDYFILDSTERKNVNTVIFPLPTKAGKGILVAPTADGNVIYGPTAVDTVNGDTASSLASLDEIRAKVPMSYKCPAFNKCIRIYSGLRTIIGHDFVIGESKIVENLFMAIGICSPGLTSAPAIAEHIVELIAQKFNPKKKESTVDRLPKQAELLELGDDELNALISKNEAWGRIVCRCEKVTEAEVVRAIHSPLPATTVDAVKRRTRAGMGRCQGGFCGPRVMEILSRELNVPLDKVKKGGGADSNIAVLKVGEVKK